VRGGSDVVVRDLPGAGAERAVAGGALSKYHPRWSCGQDRIAYAERTSGQDDARILVVRADGPGAPVVAASPGSYGGHDWAPGGTAIFYSAAPVGSTTHDLFQVPADGSASPVQLTHTPQVSEDLPTLSHRGELLAWVNVLPLAAGYVESVTVADARTLSPMHQITLQAPQGGARIGSLGFWGDDRGLYVGTKLPEIAAPSEKAKLEILSVKLDGTGKTRLTDNQLYDSQPDGIPCAPIPVCRSCAGIGGLAETAPADSLTAAGVVFEAATLPGGARSQISVTDYCPRDGVRELKVPWSQSSTGGAAHARILFPAGSFGGGPSSVDLTACHYSAMALTAYDGNGAVVSTASHTAGQGQLQTLTLGGGRIARIDVAGAEIGIRDICWRP